MAPQAGKHTNAVHTLLNSSRSKDNEVMKFGRLIEYNMRHIVLEKSYAK